VRYEKTRADDGATLHRGVLVGKSKRSDSKSAAVNYEGGRPCRATREKIGRLKLATVKEKGMKDLA